MLRERIKSVMKLHNARFCHLIKRIGFILIFCACVIITIAIFAVDFSDDPKSTLAYQFNQSLVELESLPIEVSCDGLYNEYTNDEKAADTKYKHKRLWFSNVEITDVTTHERLSGGEFVPYVSCFSSNNIRFQLSNPYIMQSVEVGYVLNIVGECYGFSGLSMDYIFIGDCWAESVLGDLGSVTEITFGY